MRYHISAVITIGYFVIVLLGGLKAANSQSPPLLSPDGHKIVSLDVRNDVAKLPIMSFYVRYPAGLSPKDKVNGVFIDLSYLTTKKMVEEFIERPSTSDANFQFADQHKLVVVTWTTMTMYSIENSFNDDTSDEREPANDMEQCFRTWKIGMHQMCRDYDLPESGYLIYGFSRGGQWAHRIVLRCPEKFLAVHIHVNSSFEEPTPEACHCIWLVTTGELEHGSKAAKIFYQKGLALNYPILLRIYPNKGHEVFPAEVTLGLKCFEYALHLKDQYNKKLAAQQSSGLSVGNGDQPLVLDDSLLEEFRRPPYYGDMLNGDVYPASQISLLPELQRVGLPDLSIAQEWGYFHP